MTVAEIPLQERDRMSQAEATRLGKSLRASVPRTSHGAYQPRADRDPYGILDTQNATRVPELVPLRMERMLATPFSFYRGAAAIMAADLADGPTTGITVVSCGDAHVSNFGLFASPQRTMVFDLNDFDEAAVAPWEWDVKRLVTSVVIGAQEAGLTAAETQSAAAAASRGYREGMATLMNQSVVERFYSRVDADAPNPLLDPPSQKVLDKATRQARTRTSEAFVGKITRTGSDGRLLLIEDPPVLTHVSEATEEGVLELFEQYRATVRPDIALLLSHFTITDIARRVVGVGSVGTRCFIMILTGPQNEVLVLQIKEAQESVLETFGRQPADPAIVVGTAPQGQRVVANQTILQAVSDLFLGHVRINGRDFYVRQFRDMKGSIDVASLKPTPFLSYAAACGWLLARAHSQSRNAPMIAGYLGASSTFDGAVVSWAHAYAEQSLADFGMLRARLSSS